MKKSSNSSQFSEPILLKRRGFFIQQASVNSDAKRFSLANILLMPIKKLRFRLKNNPSILSDYLILGDNPILLLIILFKLYKLDRKINISIFLTNQIDYWPYDLLNDEEVKSLLASFFGVEFQNISELISFVISKVSSSDNINIALINNHKNLFVNYFSYDETTKLNVFHLSVMPQSKIGSIHQITKEQNEIKESIKYETLIMIKKFFDVLSVNWGDIENAHPVLLTKNILLTSLPHGWLNFETHNADSILHLKHNFIDLSFGSSKRISHRQEDFLNEIKKSLIECIDFEI